MLLRAIIVIQKSTFRSVFPKFSSDKMTVCSAIETGRVRQSAVIHCQIRLVYSKSGVIAFVRSTRATN